MLSRISGMAERRSLSGSPRDASAVSSCRCRIGRSERGVVAPHGAHDDGELSGDRGDSLLVAAALRDLQPPGLQAAPPLVARQQALGGFVEHRPHLFVAALGNAAWPVDGVAGLVSLWRQPEMGAHHAGAFEPGRIVNRGLEGEGCHRPDPRYAHETSAHRITAGELHPEAYAASNIDVSQSTQAVQLTPRRGTIKL